MEHNHACLTKLAVKWLRRPHSRGGHGCHVSLSECWSGFDGERPDAIGFRVAGHNDGSVAVEVKTSRSDFLADAAKPHRKPGAKALGNWRYYMCPEGLISIEETPPKWGLIYVNQRGRIEVIKGPYTTTNYHERNRVSSQMRLESDHERERYILVRLLLSVGDIDEARSKSKACYRQIDALRRELSTLQAMTSPTQSRPSAAREPGKHDLPTPLPRKR